jgi:hypothetical protein
MTANDDMLDEDDIDRLLDKATDVLKKNASGEIQKPTQGTKFALGPSVRLGEDFMKPKPVKTTLPVIPDNPAKVPQKKDIETTGPKWFDMQATPMTPELEREMQLLKMRNVLDPKRHYKRDTSKGNPKFFQVGIVVDSAQDYYSSRAPRKTKNKSTVDQLLQDHDKRQYFKQKFVDIQAKKSSGKRKDFKKLKAKRKPAHQRE